MPRGEFVRKPRIWTDSNGKRRESFGRPSKEELDARGTKPIEYGDVPVVITASTNEGTETKQEEELPVISKTDALSFLAQLERLMKEASTAEALAKHSSDRMFLQGIRSYAINRMIPKYKDILNH